MSAAAEIRAALGKSRLESDALPVVEAGHAALDVETAFELGDQARRKRWPRSAIPLLVRAEAGLRDPTPARLGLIECHMVLRDWGEALRVAQRVLEQEPGHRRALRHKAKILGRLGRADEALATLELYARALHHRPGPYADLARFHAARGDWDRAIGAAKDALSREPGHEDAFEPLIDGLVALGREAEIEEHFLEMARHDPNRVIRAVRMYGRMGKALAAAHACRGLMGARGDSAEVAATVLSLRGVLTEGTGFAPDQARTALGLLDQPVGPGRRFGFASRLIASLTG